MALAVSPTGAPCVMGVVWVGGWVMCGSDRVPVVGKGHDRCGVYQGVRV